ncbi:MAG: serine hydrolase domain-containing protein [Vicinamibacterales bacterium]|nr:serine hydrolase domain-containing protein [Vicinamibacterales bacterium]
MKKRLALLLATLGVLGSLCVLGVPLSLSAAGPSAKPEDVGMSSDRLRRVHDLVQRHIDAKNFSGAVTLVARNGRVAHLEAHGLMDLESKKPMAADGIFRIMSMTKPIVGTAILMLVEEGKVRITDPVSRFIPELKGVKVAVAQPLVAGPPPPAGTTVEPRFYAIPADREITVKDLLTHTSGLVSGTISNREAGKVGLKGKETLADYLPRLGGVPIEFQPGTRWAYSAQAGFDALLRIVEVASGQRADRFLNQRIFDPLGMKDTYFYPAEGNPRFVTLYRKTPAALEKQNNPNFMNGAYFSGGGGLFSTAEDYLQFAQMLLNGGQLNGKRLLAPRTVDVMRTAFIPDTLPGRAAGEGYGLGVRVVTNPAARSTFLSQGSYGWSGAYGTHFWIDSKEKIVGILMSQTANQAIRPDFENAVMHAILEPAPAVDGRTN